MKQFRATQRGFIKADFKDANGEECSLQKSSVATEPMVWLGVNEVKPKYFPSNGTGWHDVPMGQYTQVLSSGRMHLTQAQVADLLPALVYFAEHGDLPS